jgi:hypothetical protein
LARPLSKTPACGYHKAPEIRGRKLATARTTLSRVIGNASLWPHFANRAGLEKFWALKPDQRQKIWGVPLDPRAALLDFDPKTFMTDFSADRRGGPKKDSGIAKPSIYAPMMRA